MAARKPPAYRKRTIRGREVAYLTLADARTRKRRDYWLGTYGSRESREKYARLIGEWETLRRCLPDVESPGACVTVTQLCFDYWNAVRGRYGQGEMSNIKMGIRVLRQHCGEMPVDEIGPNLLRLVRDSIARGDAASDPPRQPRSRQQANRQIHRIRAIFKWGSAHELLPVEIYRALQVVEPLRKGHSDAKEAVPVKPVPIEKVEAIREHSSRQVWALVQLQLLTGARPSEIFGLRPCDLDRSDDVWKRTLDEHKTAHHGHSRVLYFGPKAQDVLRQFLLRDENATMFSPREAAEEHRRRRNAGRKTPESCGNRRGSNLVPNPKRSPGYAYTANSYHRAVYTACDKAFPPTDGLDVDEIKAWRKEHRWNPYQLRHNYLTDVRKDHGLEAARVMAGHSSALITDAVYAERDQAVALRIASAMG